MTDLWSYPMNMVQLDIFVWFEIGSISNPLVSIVIKPEPIIGSSHGFNKVCINVLAEGIVHCKVLKLGKGGGGGGAESLPKLYRQPMLFLFLVKSIPRINIKLPFMRCHVVAINMKCHNYMQVWRLCCELLVQGNWKSPDTK